VKAYYEMHKDELESISQIRASHILVKTEEEAQKIAGRLKKGEDFATLAKKVSIDTASAKNGGDLGFFSAGQMVPEFESAAAKLKPGEISQPVKTKFGYHVIRVAEKKMGKPLEFEKIKSALFQRLSAEKQKDFFDSYIENLKKTYKVEINKEAVSKLGTEGEKQEGTQEKPGASEKTKESPKQQAGEKAGK
jgi:parvulin-like peptidyl-prolyl isomerase